MKIYSDKVRKYIKLSGMTNISIVKKLNISKPAFYKWLSEGNVPYETNIRSLARIINAPINEISDLKPELTKSTVKLSESTNSIYEIAGSSYSNNNLSSPTNEIIKHTLLLEQRLNNASIIIKGLLNSMQSIFYVKDSNLKYIITSKSFVKNLSLNSNFDPLGLDDSYFFPRSETLKNEEEDKLIIASGESIINKEGHIPGSRKKKWGIYSKTPIFDKENKITGMLCIINDITEKKKSEEISQQLEVNLNVMTEGIIIYSLDGHTYLYANKAAVELRGGFSFEELKNMGFKERLAKFVHPNDRALLFNSHIAKEWHDIENIRIKNSGGIYKHYKFTFYKSKFMGKDCIVSVQRDITDRIELIQENTNAIKTKTKAIAKKLLEKGIDKKIIAEVINL